MIPLRNLGGRQECSTPPPADLPSPPFNIQKYELMLIVFAGRRLVERRLRFSSKTVILTVPFAPSRPAVQDDPQRCRDQAGANRRRRQRQSWRRRRSSALSKRVWVLAAAPASLSGGYLYICLSLCAHCRANVACTIPRADRQPGWAFLERQYVRAVATLHCHSAAAKRAFDPQSTAPTY